MSMKKTASQAWNLVLAGLVLLYACNHFETGYFQEKVNQVTQDIVESRYGAPHKVDELPERGVVWTYFERGSGTTGFGSYVPRSECKAFVLTFDEAAVLRNWKQQECGAQPGISTEPFSNHN
jgi:hypothetical protein